MKNLVLGLASLFLLSCGDPTPTPYQGSVWPNHSEADYFSQFHAFSVGEGGTYDLVEIERRAVEMVVNAEMSVDVALDRFDTERLANALIDARDRGVIVRVVADEDRRDEAGLRTLREEGIEVVYGDGPIPWQAVFGSPLVQRPGETNLMAHNFILADRLRVLQLSGGFGSEEGESYQSGFIAVSEDFGKDFGDVFDQLHGGIFSTSQTFYDDSVSADTNNRTSYPVEDGVIEVFFGPQERLIKDVIDLVYSARAAVHIATEEFRNEELARALRYKAEAGFDVRMIVSDGCADNTECADPSGAFCIEGVCRRKRDSTATNISTIQTLAGIQGTLIVIDGQRSPLTGIQQPGRAIVISQPLSEAVPFYIQLLEPNTNCNTDRQCNGNAGLSAQCADGQCLCANRACSRLTSLRSNRFTDSVMWVIHENQVSANDDYRRMVNAFRNLEGAATP